MGLFAIFFNSLDGKLNIKNAKQRRFRPRGRKLAFGHGEDHEIVARSIERGAKDGVDRQRVDSQKIRVAGVFDFGNGINVMRAKHARERKVCDLGNISGFALAVAKNNDCR